VSYRVYTEWNRSGIWVLYRYEYSVLVFMLLLSPAWNPRDETSISFFLIVFIVSNYFCLFVNIKSQEKSQIHTNKMAKRSVIDKWFAISPHKKRVAKVFRWYINTKNITYICTNCCFDFCVCVCVCFYFYSFKTGFIFFQKQKEKKGKELYI
jgi:hypothetical protein